MITINKTYFDQFILIISRLHLLESQMDQIGLRVRLISHCLEYSIRVGVVGRDGPNLVVARRQ
jgi:hypothetical protein